MGEGSLEREEGGSVENYGRHFGVRFSNGRSSLVEKNKKFLHTGTHKHNIGLCVCVCIDWFFVYGLSQCDSQLNHINV